MTEKECYEFVGWDSVVCCALVIILAYFLGGIYSAITAFLAAFFITTAWRESSKKGGTKE